MTEDILQMYMKSISSFVKNVSNACNVNVTVTHGHSQLSMELQYCSGCSSMHYTGWPRKNATTLIVNFKNIVDETELFLILFGRTFIFQENDTMIINFG